MMAVQPFSRLHKRSIAYVVQKIDGYLLPYRLNFSPMQSETVKKDLKQSVFLFVVRDVNVVCLLTDSGNCSMRTLIDKDKIVTLRFLM